MKKIRIGNDFVLSWAIERGGVPENLENVLDKHLYMIVFGTKTEIHNYTVSGNNIIVEFTPELLNKIGIYTLIFYYVLPDTSLSDDDRKCTVDIDAFQIVPKTAMADDVSEFAVTSDMAIAFKGDKGDSAYQIWLNEGNIGTIDDYFEWLRQPAIDAASIANSAAELAETKAVEAETAAELADAARLAIQDEVNEVKVKNAEQGNSIKEIEKIISTSNLNQTSKVNSSGYKTISLPKIASNGGMDVKLEGLTAQNLVVNGDFRDGRVGWNGRNSTLSELNGIISINGNGKVQTPAAEGNVVNWVSENKYYIKYRLRVTNSNCDVFRIRANYSYINLFTYSPIENLWYERSGINTSTGTGAQKILLEHSYENAAMANGKTMEVDYVMIINLTETFGAGNEPSVAACDAMFSTYIDGTKSFEPTGRLRVTNNVGKTISNFYLTAPELRSNGLVKDEIRKGENRYELIQRINAVDGTVLATPIITPIYYAGILNSSESGTVYHEHIITDAGIYGTNMTILNTDYPISYIEEIIKHDGGIDTYLNVETAVISPDGLSFTHPDLAEGDLVLFTYAFNKETTNGLITASYYDSRYVIADSTNGKFYKWRIASTNGTPQIILTEV